MNAIVLLLFSSHGVFLSPSCPAPSLTVVLARINTHIRGHIECSSPTPSITVRHLHFIAGRVQHHLPPSTRAEMSLPSL